ncbi:copper amine oxidase N-terminal domain-containing protein [Ammonifex thiophilus]|uniref:Copper amine oxidase N-terminal domain-containing protein n=2 Tax=Ammonifex thiophilus TaxID=444093 RepID=A0A3D8P7R1_9THEO|nr:copper amine oxidase N-terminal domain-containing protein [Ammonifex thiophilus]
MLALLAVGAVAVWGADTVKLVVNGKEIKPDVPPVISGDRVLVPVRWVAEALKCRVDWDGRTSTVYISNDLERRLELLEKALAPATPRAAVEEWARGVQTRNGALQYALFSPELRQQKYADFASLGWVTSTSSPWVEKYGVIKEVSLPGGKWLYEVKFDLMTSTGPAGSQVMWVTVAPCDQHWCVANLEVDPVLEELQGRAADLLKEMYQHYQLLNLAINCLSFAREGKQAEAIFATQVHYRIGVASPSEWPVQKGRIRFLEENRSKLTPEQIRQVEEKIAFWDQELRRDMQQPEEANLFLKVVAELNDRGEVLPATVKFFYQDPLGNYLPFNKQDWPQFASAAELEQQGYDEMRQLVVW